MKEICFSVLLADSDVLVASFALFWHNKTFLYPYISLYPYTFVDTKLDCSGPGLHHFSPLLKTCFLHSLIREKRLKSRARSINFSFKCKKIGLIMKQLSGDLRIETLHC